MTESDSVRSPETGHLSVQSVDSYSSRNSPVIKGNFDTDVLVDEEALQRTMDCESVMRVRTQQLDEKRRFLEYQTKLVSELMADMAEERRKKKEFYHARIAEQEEKVSLPGHLLKSLMIDPFL